MSNSHAAVVNGRAFEFEPSRIVIRDGPLFFWRGGGGGGGGGGGVDEKSLSANNFFLTTPSCKQFFFDLF